MQATNTTTFSSHQTPYVSPVQSFFKNELAKKIALIATAIIGMLAIIFLREYGLAIVVVLSVGVWLTSSQDAARVAQPVITASHVSAPVSEKPAYPEPQGVQKSEETNSETCCSSCVDSCLASSSSDNNCGNNDSCWDDDIHGTALTDCLSSLCGSDDTPMTRQSTTNVTFSRR